MNTAASNALENAHRTVREALLGELGNHGHWEGELSSSALSTATAVIALHSVDADLHAQFVQNGLRWLADHVNPDGGWGDTIRSRSNLSTTALVWAAFGVSGADRQFPQVIAGATNYIEKRAGSVKSIVPAIEALYGSDRTFSVPITMTLALSGRLGPNGWKRVRSLPFELAALPRGFFGALRLPVVSYALPALIAIGQVIHHHNTRFNPLRSLTRTRTLDLLVTLQPENGGFLEAVPLTSFVTMSMASMGLPRHIVAERGAQFLRQAVRSDGSWPIDTNLCTWVSTLSVKALHHTPSSLTSEQRKQLLDWLIQQQHTIIHPYTGAAPGGWAWCDLPGGVPDADDTAGALVVLAFLKDESDARIVNAAEAGIGWLLGLQNSDGGIPTFCRGWGTLPFDRSAPELTAHALRAWHAWSLEFAQSKRIEHAVKRACEFLRRSQRPDGAWVPLWFGNEHAPAEENPVYGTAQVLIGIQSLNRPNLAEAIRRGREFLRMNQNDDGGWGGAAGAPSSIEETSLAIEALADADCSQVTDRGVTWLLKAIEAQAWQTPTPIGLYFARLWYFEKLYPLIFACSALGKLASKRV